MKKTKDPLFDRSKTRNYHIRRKLVTFSIYLFVWIGIAVAFYAVFSPFLDTPIEYKTKQTVKLLEKQYKLMQQRYDSIDHVMQNIEQRDQWIYGMLFESTPPKTEDAHRKPGYSRSALLKMTNSELGEVFFRKIKDVTSRITESDTLMLNIMDKAAGSKRNYQAIPSIQPIVNNDLHRLATSMGERIHPFFKNIAYHKGVDYAVPEGTRVFATADGTVYENTENRNLLGTTLVINHGNGYKTYYGNLGTILVEPGQRVKRGDVVATTGNSGLSYAPHLHYQIDYNGMPVDPICYFFQELDPAQYAEIRNIAHSGMQSFD